MRLSWAAAAASFLPARAHVHANRSGVVTGVHIAVGVLAIALSAAAGLFGIWCWWRKLRSAWFWRLLRAAQAVIVLQAVLGGVLILTGSKPPSLHVIYGLLPILVSFLAEQLRIASAQMVLDSHGFGSPQEVGELPADEQQKIVVTILQRELGVMTLAALIIVVLLARAAGTA